MAPATQLEPDGTGPIMAQIREAFGRLVYSHKTHEKTADIYLDRLRLLKTVQILLSALTTGGLLVILLGNPADSTIAAGVSAALSTILLGINTYTKDFDLGQLAEQHAGAAADLWRVREGYLSLIADLQSGATGLATAVSRRDELQEELGNIYAAAPRTLPAAYARAGLALGTAEEFTFSAEEIDRFLPPGLRADYSEDEIAS